MKYKKISVYFAALSSAIILANSSVSAQEETPKETTEEKTIENAFAQCGIGAIFFPKSETAAVFSNTIWDFGTTALSSQSSSPSSCAGVKTTAAVFIDRTYPVLEEQFVKGEGAHVIALLDLLQCDTSVQAGVINNVQNDLAASFSDTEFVAATQQDKAVKMAAILDKATLSCSA